MEKYDPPPNWVKPVPFQFIRRITYIAQHSKCTTTQSTADMITLAFFSLIGTGKYT